MPQHEADPGTYWARPDAHICTLALMATKYPAAEHIGGTVRVTPDES
jgi:hypothetical protein